MATRLLASVLVLLSWVSSTVHVLLTGYNVQYVDWFLLKPISKTTGMPIVQELQWYIYDLGSIFSFLFLALSFKVLIKKFALLDAIILITLIELIHYITYFKQSQWVIILEVLILLKAVLKKDQKLKL